MPGSVGQEVHDTFADGLLILRFFSLVNSMVGMILLNAELKPINRIIAYVYWFARCKSTQCSATASSGEDLLWTEGIFLGCARTSCSKLFITIGLSFRHSPGTAAWARDRLKMSLKTHMSCSCSKNMSHNTIRTSRLTSIDMAQ